GKRWPDRCACTEAAFRNSASSTVRGRRFATLFGRPIDRSFRISPSGGCEFNGGGVARKSNRRNERVAFFVVGLQTARCLPQRHRFCHQLLGGGGGRPLQSRRRQFGEGHCRASRLHQRFRLRHQGVLRRSDVRNGARRESSTIRCSEKSRGGRGRFL